MTGLINGKTRNHNAPQRSAIVLWVAAVAMLFSAFSSYREGDVYRAIGTSTLAIIFGIMATGEWEGSRGIRLSVYVMLAISFGLLALRLLGVVRGSA